MEKYFITKEQILETVRTGTDVTKRYLNEILPEAFKPELKAGQWYIASCLSTNGYLVLAEEITDQNEVRSNYWFSPSKTYVNCTGLFDRVERLATEEEVSAALIAEAKKQGFGKRGVKFIDVENGKESTMEGNYLYVRDNTVRHLNQVIFKDGKWAEILPEEKKEETPKEKTLEIIKGEKYICRKEIVNKDNGKVYFKRCSIYNSEFNGNLTNEQDFTHHNLSENFAYKHFLHLPK